MSTLLTAKTYSMTYASTAYCAFLLCGFEAQYSSQNRNRIHVFIYVYQYLLFSILFTLNLRYYLHYNQILISEELAKTQAFRSTIPSAIRSDWFCRELTITHTTGTDLRLKFEQSREVKSLEKGKNYVLFLCFAIWPIYSYCLLS